MSKPILIYDRDSGAQPDSAARGTRQLSQPADGPEPHPTRLGANLAEVGLWLIIAVLAAACILVEAL